VKSGGLLPLDHGGKIRSFHLAKELARTHEVSLFTFYEPMAEDPHEDLKGTFAEVVCVPLNIPRKNGMAEYIGYAKNLFSPWPYSVTKYCQPHVARALRRHLESKSYDVILCDFLLTAGVIPWDLAGPKVLFTHNVEAQIWQRHFDVARNPVWKAACYREFRTMARMERDYLRRAEHVLAVSEADRQIFAHDLDASRISVIPTGVDADYFQPAPEMEEPNALVFTGSMDWLPNEDGILYFAEKILPIVRNEVPDTMLWVVGRRPSQNLLKLQNRVAGIKVTGRVEDIRPYIGRASVYVVPLLVGGGTRLKIFEAMAMGKAIVSTRIGAEGLPVVSGEHICLADEAEEFAGQTIALLKQPERRAGLGEAARTLVERSYSWDSVGKELSNVMVRVSEDFRAKKERWRNSTNSTA
jgi:sugar transferase (PEP-CTERM/EpsH1 system associated)